MSDDANNEPARDEYHENSMNFHSTIASISREFHGVEESCVFAK